MPRRLPYEQGDQFVVPVDRRWVTGVVARLDGHHGVLGYFFLPPSTRPPTSPALLQSGDAALIAIFGDLAFLDGRWSVVGPTPSFQASDWPVPVFGHPDALRPNLGWLVAYDDDLQETTRQVVPILEIAGRPTDGAYGWRAMEIALARAGQTG